MSEPRIAVILLNMGGPEQLHQVLPFLTNLFSDRNIIRLGPKFLQKPLARLIARRRAPKSTEMYKKIGGGSPLCRITKEQAAALESELQPYGNYQVRVAMRYWHPFAEETLTELHGQVDQILALSLYPHFSRATTGSSLTDLQHTIARICPSLPMTAVVSWPDHPGYIKALAQCINEGRNTFSSGNPQIIFSAHSLPQSFIDDGDPYLDDIGKTLDELERSYSIKGQLSFQSRSGPVKWLEPSTTDMIEQLANQGCKEILVVPISFVSDHIETLYEIQILFKENARSRGVQLECSPALNTRPEFIDCLRDLVLTQHC